MTYDARLTIRQRDYAVAWADTTYGAKNKKCKEDKRLNYSIFVTQLDSLLDSYNDMRRKSKYSDLSDMPETDRQSLVTRCVGAIERMSGSRSAYSKEVHRILKQPGLHMHMPGVLGVAQALRDDLKGGFLQTFTELVHAELFADFLDMAQHLNDAGYKDAAAVIAGSALESHLRELATKNAIATSDASGRPIKADKINADLAKVAVYSVLDQKSITAFLDLRNKAAHGKYSEYTKEQVETLISGIADFIKRMPA